MGEIEFVVYFFSGCLYICNDDIMSFLRDASADPVEQTKVITTVQSQSCGQRMRVIVCLRVQNFKRQVSELA